MTKTSDDKRNGKSKQASKKQAPRTKRSAGKAAADTAALDAQSEKAADKIKKSDEKALKALIQKGKAQGSLTYDEINAALPDEMMSSEMIDDTLMMFDDMDIEIIETGARATRKAPTAAKKETAGKAISVSDFGSVTDPVKMYLREMGMVTLLSREGEVEIAKKIEEGEQDVLKALLETSLGVKYILEFGELIEKGALRPKHVLRDVDEGDAYVDEMVQIENFLETISAIHKVNDEIKAYRERMFTEQMEPDEARRVRRCIMRRNNKIFELLKGWRLEGGVIDRIEAHIRQLIEWFDAQNKLVAVNAEAFGTTIREFREKLNGKAGFLKWAQKRSQLDDDALVRIYAHLTSVSEQLVIKENAFKANNRNLKRVMALFPRLVDRQKQLASTMSGGEARMLAVARGLMSNADFLCIDEPSLGLQPSLRHEIFSIIRQINEQGKTVFLVEQNIPQIAELADRVYVMEEGRISFEGDRDEALSNEHLKEIFLGM